MESIKTYEDLSLVLEKTRPIVIIKTTELIHKFKPREIINFGTAGSLNNKLNGITKRYHENGIIEAVMNFIELRNEKTAQIEIQEYARVLLNQMKEVFPKTTELWSEAHGWV